MRKTRLGLMALGAVALVWRLAVLIDASNSPLLDESAGRGDIALIVARGLMGLVFLLCGATVLKRRRSKRSALFVLYAFCAAIHWGGPLFAASEQLQLAVWMVYFTVSAMLAQSAFLHFSLVFPEPWVWAPRHATRFLIYLPVAFGSVAAGLAVASAPGAASEAWRDKFFILEGLQANLFALASLVILSIRWLRAGPEDGPRPITGPMALGAWLSVLPWILALALESAGVGVPGGSDVYTLFFVLLPLVCTWAILRYQPLARSPM